jgi:DNA-binding transcriptional LysR family regulator
MDRFESMSTFVAVVEAGGFSAASRRLGMPLATVSRKVSELEDELRVQLLVRSTRQIALTENGQQYFATCRRLLDELSEAERLVTGEFRAPRGGLVVSAPIVFGRLHLTPVIVAFLKAYPEVHIELRLDDSIAHLIEEQVDVALRIGALPDSGMMAAKAGDIRQVVCASPAYLESRGTPAEPADLAGHDCVTFLLFDQAHEWAFRTGRGVKRYPVSSRLSVSTAEAAVDAAIAGLGVTRVLCYQVKTALEDGRLQLLMREHEFDPMPVNLVYAGGRLVPQKLRAFLDFAMPRLKAMLVFNL